MAEVVPFVFLVPMKDINKPRLANSAGVEHTFDILRTVILEFTPMELVQLI